MLKGAKRNYDPGKLAAALPQIYLSAFKPMIRELNGQIQDNIDNSTDIGGSSFKKLENSTTSIRKKRGQAKGPPLLITGKMRGTKIIQATVSRPVFTIEMTGKRKSVYYGALHNRGFTSGGMIPGKKVPQRKWFGIPKEFKKGGTKYEEARRQTSFLIRNALRTSMKRIV